MTAPAPLDLGKPMRWKNGKTVTVVHHGKAGAALKTEGAQWPHWYTPTELDELFENIPPEPPRGPEEAWVFVGKRGQVVCALLGDSPRSAQYVRYLRADLATTNAARKVRPLTSHECQKLHEADTWCDLDSAFIAIMAARGIEVGE